MVSNVYDDLRPLTTLDAVGCLTGGEREADPSLRRDTLDKHGLLYHVICRLCGNVTRRESGGTVNDARLQQAGLYRQRHLAKHLSALAQEVEEATR